MRLGFFSLPVDASSSGSGPAIQHQSAAPGRARPDGGISNRFAHDSRGNRLGALKSALRKESRRLIDHGGRRQHELVVHSEVVGCALEAGFGDRDRAVVRFFDTRHEATETSADRTGDDAHTCVSQTSPSTRWRRHR